MSMGYPVKDCPIGLDVCYPSCYFSINGKCEYDRVIGKDRSDIDGVLEINPVLSGGVLMGYKTPKSNIAKKHH